jgi:cytosine permease
LILLAAGIPFLAVIMAVGNVWTTNDANLYSASLGISKALPVTRQSAVLISAFVSVIIAYQNPAQMNYFSNFLIVLGNTAPALGGVVFGAYFFLKHRTAKPHPMSGWIGWAAGSAVSYSLNSFTTAGVLAVPTSFLIGFVVWRSCDCLLTVCLPQQAEDRNM